MQADIDFSQNWNNKLDCDAFTTIRISNDKYEVGAVFNVNLKRNRLFSAKILEKKRFKLNQLNEFMARLDTGYSAKETIELIRTMYKKKNLDLDAIYFDFILLKRI